MLEFECKVRTLSGLWKLLAFESGALHFTLQYTFRHRNAHRDYTEQKITANEGNIEDNANNLGIVEGQVNSTKDKGQRTSELNKQKNQWEQSINRAKEHDENEIKINENTAWVTKPTKETREDEMVNLPDSWVRCDGSTIAEPSVWAGQLQISMERIGS